MSRVFVTKLDGGYLKNIESGFKYIGNKINIHKETLVCIKPNLTFPTFRRGVMTNPEAIEALIIYLKNFTSKIIICESDSGGYNSFSMDEVFRATGITEFKKKYGVRIVNLSNEPSRTFEVNCGFKRCLVPLPIMLLDEIDLFITMPVPKMHLNTVVSLAIKNQWGVIQQPSLRLKLHPYFKEVIYQINKALPRSLVITDGKYGLTRSGPLRGEELHLNWLLIANNIFIADYVAAYLMGINYCGVPYLKYIFARENIRTLDDIEFNTELDQFICKDFYLKREWTDYPGIFTFNSRLLAYIGYESFLAKPLHWFLYKFREPFY